MRLIDCPELSDAPTFNNKVMGVMDHPEKLNRLLRALDALGAEETEVLSGSAGARCLQNVKSSVGGFLDAVLGDMESAMLKVYLQAVESGLVVFAVPCASENREPIVDAAIRAGAHHVVHFGQTVHESFENRTGDLPP